MLRKRDLKEEEGRVRGRWNNEIWDFKEESEEKEEEEY